MSLTILSRVSPAWPDGRLAIELSRWLEQFTGEPVWIRPIKTQGVIPADVRERFAYGQTPSSLEIQLIQDATNVMPQSCTNWAHVFVDKANQFNGDACLEIARALVAKGKIERPQFFGRVGPGDAYYHSGNLGDIIYGLYAIREAEGGQLLCGPNQRTANLFAPITREQFALLRPLLDVQPYLNRCAWREHYPAGEIKWDMNVFRDWWLRWALRQWENLHNLCEMQFFYLGIRDRFDPTEPWLEVPDEIETGRIVIHRSPRYNQSDTPWYWLTRNLREHLLFVGLPEEHAEFEKKFGPVSYWKCRDFLEMAQVIAGAEGYCGNQSFAMALAIGIGQWVWQETCEAAPDCLFARSSFCRNIEEVAAWIA